MQADPITPAISVSTWDSTILHRRGSRNVSCHEYGETNGLITKFKLGDEVYARVADFQIGTFAEFIAVNENDLVKIK